ncbi:hypothetical protein AB9M62_31685 [Bacillales bacterium AN1005]
MALTMKAWMKSSLVLGLIGGLLAGCTGGDSSEQAEGEGNRGNITSTIYDRGAVPSGMGTIEDNMWSKWINENGRQM